MAYDANCVCPDCEAQRPKAECEGCKAKDKTITQLIAALSLQREPAPVRIGWTTSPSYPPQVPSYVAREYPTC